MNPDSIDFAPINNAFGKLLNDLPILDLGSNRGDTDYIDFIEAKGMVHPIMKGTDCVHRPFISIKLVVQNTEGQTSLAVVTIFQRYTDDKSVWTVGSCYKHNLLCKSGQISKTDYVFVDRLKRLINGEKINDIKLDTKIWKYVDGNNIIYLSD